MGSPMAPSNVTLIGLDRSKSMSLRFRSLISHRTVELGHSLPLYINRKPNMGSQMVPSHLMFSELERSKSRSLRF